MVFLIIKSRVIQRFGFGYAKASKGYIILKQGIRFIKIYIVK